MQRRASSIALGILAASFIGQGILQRGFIFDKWSKDYSPNAGSLDGTGLDGQQMLFALAGFRELIAGILWVRADSFFDSGNYDAILPIIRLVTILDPHQIDVFATGMWHIGYNFTDEEQRSDRRYLPSALALGAEGAEQNPKTYEMFFETGWMWYHKIDDDYGKAVSWFNKAQEKDDMIAARKNLLGMAYQRSGEVEKGLEMYQTLYDKAVAEYKKSKEYGNRQNTETIEGNIDTMMVRMVQRGYIASKEKRSLEGYDVTPPHDVQFSAKASVIDPRVIRFEGTWNVRPVGTRVRVVLRDAKYTTVLDDKEVDITVPGGLKWDYSNNVNLDPPRDRTFMQDQLFVRNRRFNRKVDMSKDPTMYPFTSDEYVMEFYYNPRSAPPHIQDKFSWNGEGMTDSNYLNTEVRPGQRVVFCQLKISRDQILRRGEWQDRTPVLKTPNYKEIDKAVNKDDVIVDIPSLRGGN